MDLSPHLRLATMSAVLPSMALDFVSQPILSDSVTFNRSSTATRIGQDGLMQTVAVDVPRFDYDPVSLAPKGLLIEEARTNLLLRSLDISNAYWLLNSSVSKTTIPVTSPDGTSNAYGIIETTTTGSHALQANPSPSISASTTYTYSAYVKRAAGARSFTLQVNLAGGTTGAGFAWFNLDTGVATGPTQISATFVGVASGMQNVGNGWYRCWMTFTSNAGNTSATVFVGLYNTTTGGRSYTGDGTSGLHLWGMQLEAGAFVTSYIPTVASTATRSADIAIMTGANFSNWYNASEGTFVASYGASPNQFATYIAASNGVVGQNSIHFDNDSGGAMRAVYYSGSVAQAILSLGAYGTAGTINKVASAYAVNDFAASRNGGAVVTDASGALPVSPTQFNIGADPSGAAVNVTNSHIRTIAYYNRRLPNIQLQALSA